MSNELGKVRNEDFSVHETVETVATVVTTVVTVHKAMKGDKKEHSKDKEK